MNTLMGLETEYALTVLGRKGDRRDPSTVSSEAMEAVEKLFPNLEARGSGLFLLNGGRIYPDVGDKVEYCTPECPSPLEIVRYTLAGDRIMARVATALEKLHRGTCAMVSRGNTGYGDSPSSWASHESYLCRKSPDAYAEQLVPFLASRLIYAGAGGLNPFSAGVEFSISPRALFIKAVHSGDTQSVRAILNLRDEPLADIGYHQLHLILGDALGSHKATYLRHGATALVVALIDSGVSPIGDLVLTRPLDAIRAFAADQTVSVTTPTRTGEITAIEIQQRYVDAVRDALPSGRLPCWAAEVVEVWQQTLNELRADRERLSNVLDWMIKRDVYADHCRSRGFELESLPPFTAVVTRLRAVFAEAKQEFPTPFSPDDAPNAGAIRAEIRRQDRFLDGHGLDLNDVGTFQILRAELFELDTKWLEVREGLFQLLDSEGLLNHRLASPVEIDRAVCEPPSSGRAALRGRFVREFAGQREYRVGWTELVNERTNEAVSLGDPFTESLVWTKQPTGPVTGIGLRDRAFDLFLQERYAEARSILSRLAGAGFELTSTYCHLARLAILTDDLDAAESHAETAEEFRASAESTIVPRVYWLKIALTMLRSNSEPGPALFVGFRSTLEATSSYSWRIQPVLDHIRDRVSPENHRLLTKMAEAMEDHRKMRALEAFPQWRDALTQATT